MMCPGNCLSCPYRKRKRKLAVKKDSAIRMTETEPVTMTAPEPEKVVAESTSLAVIDKIPEYEVRRTITGKLRARLMER